MDMSKHGTKHEEGSSPYKGLLWMSGLSLLSMYILMYAMVNSFSNVYNSLNQLYMAGLMTAPMVILEIVLMRAMYRNKKLNALLLSMSAVAGVACWTLIRQQGAITDEQFLRSMIPHHAGAILMCQEAPLRDSRLQELCTEIISSQQSEIDFMKARLAELDR